MSEPRVEHNEASSRRNVIKGILVTGVSFLLGNATRKPHGEQELNNKFSTLKPKIARVRTGREFETTSLDRYSDEADQTRAQMEEKYGIKISTYHQVSEQIQQECAKLFGGSLEGFQNGCEEIPKKWDLKGLNILEHALKIFPEHFYDSGGFEPVHFVLSKQGCVCRAYENPNIVQLPHNVFTPETELLARDIIGHELTHRITPKTLTENKQFANSEWFNLIYEIVGGTLNKPPEQMRTKTIELGRTLEAIEAEYGNDKYIVERLNYGVRNHFPNELLAVASEFWLWGKDNFNEVFVRILTPDQTNQMAQFVQNTIYREKKY